MTRLIAWFKRLKWLNRLFAISALATIVGTVLAGIMFWRSFTRTSAEVQHTSVAKSPNVNIVGVTAGGNITSVSTGDNAIVTIGDDFSESPLERLNKTFDITIRKLSQEPFTSSNGIKRVVSRPVISGIFSASEPKITFDKGRNKYIVEVTQYVADPTAENGKRLETQTVESEGSMEPPTIQKVN